MNQKPESTEHKEMLTPEAVACAVECNTQWQDCQDNNPEHKSCHTKLAKCVKSCDSEKK